MITPDTDWITKITQHSYSTLRQVKSKFDVNLGENWFNEETKSVLNQLKQIYQT